MKNIQLSLMSAKDLDLFKALYCDNEIMHFLSGGMSDSAASEFFYELIENQCSQSPKNLIYKIMDEAETIGLVGGFFIKDSVKTVYLGAMILKRFQQKGYSTKAIRVFSQKVKQKYGVARITTKSKVANTGATKLMHKLNFKLDDVTVSEGGDQYNNWYLNLSSNQHGNTGLFSNS